MVGSGGGDVVGHVGHEDVDNVVGHVGHVGHAVGDDVVGHGGHAVVGGGEEDEHVGPGKLFKRIAESSFLTKVIQETKLPVSVPRHLSLLAAIRLL